MTLDDLAAWLSGTWLAEAMTDSTWLFGVVEAVHVMALTVVLGSIALVDLGLIGLIDAGPDRAARARQLLPLTWTGFAIAAMTGTAMIFANPQGYLTNTFFRGKILLLLAAGVNVALFHFVIEPRRWRMGERISGAVSLVLWLTVVSFGRWIGFTI